jgi:hypothetical protein
MKTYSIPVYWSVAAKMEIEANNLEEALAIADEAPLPSDGDYIEGSFEINRQVIPFWNKLTTEEKKICNVICF